MYIKIQIKINLLKKYLLKIKLLKNLKFFKCLLNCLKS
jgi:hypothetical protein